MGSPKPVGILNIVIGVTIIFVMVLYIATFNKLSQRSGGDTSQAGDTNDAGFIAFVYPPDSITGRYLRETNQKSFSPDQGQLDTFIEANRGPLYTPVPEDQFTVIQNRGPEVITNYLNSLSLVYNPSFQPVTSEDIENSFRQLVETGNSAPLDEVIDRLEKNQALLRDAQVPVEMALYHGKFLGATISLKENLILIKEINSDYVAGLIGARNVDSLVSVFDELAQEVKGFQEKYNL